MRFNHLQHFVHNQINRIKYWVSRKKLKKRRGGGERIPEFLHALRSTTWDTGWIWIYVCSICWGRRHLAVLSRFSDILLLSSYIPSAGRPNTSCNPICLHSHQPARFAQVWEVLNCYSNPWRKKESDFVWCTIEYNLLPPKLICNAHCYQIYCSSGKDKPIRTNGQNLLSFLPYLAAVNIDYDSFDRIRRLNFIMRLSIPCYHYFFFLH